MFFQHREQLEEIVVQAIARSPGRSAQQLAALLGEQGHIFSRAALYKELAKLLTQGVLVRRDRLWYLSLTWILQALSFARTLEERYLGNPEKIVPLPAPGESVKFHLDSLLRANDLSSHVVLLLVSQAQEKIVYSWNPHPWFYLVQGSHEAGYIRSLKLAGGRFYKVIGGNTPLDRWTERFWKNDATRYAFSPTGFERDRALCYNVVEDYIASFRIDRHGVNVIDRLYRKAPDYDSLNVGELFSLFRDKYQITFKIEHNAQKAGRLRRRFKRFFGC